MADESLDVLLSDWLPALWLSVQSAGSGPGSWPPPAVNVINNSQRALLQRKPELDGRLHVAQLMDQLECSPLLLPPGSTQLNAEDSHVCVSVGPRDQVTQCRGVDGLIGLLID